MDNVPIFIAYANSYQRSIQTVKRLCAENATFAQLVHTIHVPRGKHEVTAAASAAAGAKPAAAAAATAAAAAGGAGATSTLEELLRRPLERLDAGLVDLDELRKYTPSTHPDAAALAQLSHKAHETLAATKTLGMGLGVRAGETPLLKVCFFASSRTLSTSYYVITVDRPVGTEYCVNTHIKLNM